MNHDKQQLLVQQTASHLSEAILNCEKLGGFNYKQRIADLTSLCRNGIKVVGIDKQIENDLCSALEDICGKRQKQQQQQQQQRMEQNENVAEHAKEIDAVVSFVPPPEHHGEIHNRNSRKLRWTIIVQELRSLKRKYPQAQQTSTSSAISQQLHQHQHHHHHHHHTHSTNQNILPALDTELGAVLKESFLAIHFLVESVSMVREFGPDSLSPLLVQNDAHVRRAVQEWKNKLTRHQRHHNDDDDDVFDYDDDEEKIASANEGRHELAVQIKKRQHAKQVLKALYYHQSTCSSSLGDENETNHHDEDDDNDDIGENSSAIAATVTTESSRALLLSREWLKVDSVLVLRNGNFLRHELISDFFTCPPSLLSSYRRLKLQTSAMTDIMQQNQYQQPPQRPLQQVVEQLRMHREKRQQPTIVTTRLMTTSSSTTTTSHPLQQPQEEISSAAADDDAAAEVVVGSSSSSSVSLLKEDVALRPIDETQRQAERDERIVPIKFIGSHCMDNVLRMLSKVC